MKKILIFTSLIMISLILCNKIEASGLSYTQTKNTTTVLTEGLKHHHIKATTKTDYGTNGNQNVNALIKEADSDVLVASWTKMNSNNLSNMTIASLAKDFEKNNPNYEVIAGVNGDYFANSNTISANSNFNGDILNSMNHTKYFNIYVSKQGELLGESKQTEYLGYELSVYKEDVIIYSQSINSLNDETSDTIIYNNKKPSDSKIDVYVTDTLDNNIILSNHVHLKGKINNKVTNTFISGDKIGISTTNEKLIELLDTNPKIRVQPILKQNKYINSMMIGVGSKTLENSVVREFDEIVDQNISFSSARAARTSIGFTKTGGIVLATMDKSVYSGVNLREEALIMKELGCTTSFNLDGGGSTSMIIKNSNNEFEYVNTYTEKRPVLNAIFFVKPKILSSTQHNFSELLANEVTLDFDIKLPGDSIIKKIELLVNEESTILKNNLFQTIKVKPTNLNSLNRVSIKILYRNNNVDYTEVAFNSLVNFDSKTGDREIMLPHNFNIVYDTDSNKLTQTVTYDDPDNMIVNIYIKNLDNQKISTYKNPIIFENPLNGTVYNYSLSYSYRENGKTVVKEIDDSFSYKYENDDKNENDNDDDLDENLDEDNLDENSEGNNNAVIITISILILLFIAIIIITFISKRGTMK